MAEHWTPTWRRRRAVPTMLRAERALQRMLRLRFTRQAAHSYPRIVAALKTELGRYSESQTFVQPHAVNGILDLYLDTSVEEGDVLALRRQQDVLARQAAINTLQHVG